MSALENMDLDQNYKYVIEKFEPDCQNGHDMIICFDSKLTKKQLELLPIVVF